MSERSFGRNDGKHQCELVEHTGMKWIGELLRGFGATRPESVTIWVDACQTGYADVGAVPAALVVVPAWHNRLALVRLLRRRDCRLIVEREQSDRALERVACRAWGEVIWGSNGSHVRPAELKRMLGLSFEQLPGQLASGRKFVEPVDSQRTATDERRRKRQDDPRTRGR